MSNDLKNRLAQAAQQNAGADTSDAMRQAKAAAEQAGLEGAGSGQGQATAGAGSTQRPVQFSQADIKKKVESYSDDQVKQRLANSRAEITKLLAKQPNAVRVVLDRDGENKTYTADESLLSKVQGLTADTQFPLARPKKMRASIDGYFVRKPDSSGNLGPEEAMTKRQLGDWIKDYALVRIGTEERGARVAEKKVLNSEVPYSLSVWGLDASNKDDVKETFEVDAEAGLSDKKFFLDTGANVYKDATGTEVKIFTKIPFPKYERQKDFVDTLGPIRLNRKGPPTSKFEIEDTLKTLAKISILEDRSKQNAAN